MNISTQTKQTAQSNQLQHSGIFLLNSPSNSVVANMAWQLNQELKQSSYGTQFNIGDAKYCVTRVRMFLHDGGLQCIQLMLNSLDPQLPPRLEQNQLSFWKLDQGDISNV